MKTDKVFLTKEEFETEQKFHKDIESQLPVIHYEILKSCFDGSGIDPLYFDEFLSIYSKTGRLVYNIEELEKG